MLTLDYSKNYNGKLFSDTFPDIRQMDPAYYVGQQCLVTLSSLKLGLVRIEAIQSFMFGKINDTIAFNNIGQPAQAQAQLLNRMYNQGKTLPFDTKFYYMALAYVSRDLETTSELLQQWWEQKKSGNG